MNWLKHAFQYFFSSNFQFAINRVRLETVDKVFGGIAVALVAIGVVSFIVSRLNRNIVTKRFLRRVQTWSLTMGLLGLVWFAARYQLVALFGTHLAFLIVLLVAIIWLWHIISYRLRVYTHEKEVWEKEQLKQKYLARQN